jgi:hypothetical protein
MAQKFCDQGRKTTFATLSARNGHAERTTECLLSEGVFNRLTQRLLILLEEEVCDGGAGTMLSLEPRRRR